MIDEKIFAYAVTIASAFVANGDIRCGGSTKEGIAAFAQVEDLLPPLYDALQGARRSIEEKLSV